MESAGFLKGLTGWRRRDRARGQLLELAQDHLVLRCLLKLLQHSERNHPAPVPDRGISVTVRCRVVFAPTVLQSREVWKIRGGYVIRRFEEELVL